MQLTRELGSMSIGEGTSQSPRLTPSQVQARDGAVTQAPPDSSPPTNLVQVSELSFQVHVVIDLICSG